MDNDVADGRYRGQTPASRREIIGCIFLPRDRKLPRHSVVLLK